MQFVLNARRLTSFSSGVHFKASRRFFPRKIGMKNREKIADLRAALTRDKYAERGPGQFPPPLSRGHKHAIVRGTYVHREPCFGAWFPGYPIAVVNRTSKREFATQRAVGEGGFQSFNPSFWLVPEALEKHRMMHNVHWRNFEILKIGNWNELCSKPKGFWIDGLAILLWEEKNN